MKPGSQLCLNVKHDQIISAILEYGGKHDKVLYLPMFHGILKNTAAALSVPSSFTLKKLHFIPESKIKIEMF